MKKSSSSFCLVHELLILFLDSMIVVCVGGWVGGEWGIVIFSDLLMWYVCVGGGGAEDSDPFSRIQMFKENGEVHYQFWIELVWIKLEFHRW